MPIFKENQFVCKELTLQKQICKYLKLQYPNVIFRMNFTTGKPFMEQFNISGYPDLFIAEPTHEYNGLFIEIKREGTELWKKKAYEYLSEHIKQQANVLYKLQQLGYAALFGIGWDHCKRIIDCYLKNEVCNCNPQTINGENLEKDSCKKFLIT